MDLHIGRVILRYDCLLLRKISDAFEHEVRTRRGNLDIQLLTQCIHIAANLLQVNRGHVDDAREVEGGNLNLLHIRVEQLEEIVGDSGLLRVFHTDSELVRIGRREIQSQTVIVTHRLDELEKIDHVDSQHMLGRAVIVLEPVAVKTEEDKNRVSLIDGHDLDTIRVELEVGLRQNLL